MNEREYDRADNELFAMLNGKKPTGRKTVGIVVPAKRAKELEFIEGLLFQISDLLPIAGWLGASGLFAAATVFGWMHVIFGSIVAAFTFGWAAWRFWRWRHWS